MLRVLKCRGSCSTARKWSTSRATATASSVKKKALDHGRLRDLLGCFAIRGREEDCLTQYADILGHHRAPSGRRRSRRSELDAVAEDIAVRCLRTSIAERVRLVRKTPVMDSYHYLRQLWLTDRTTFDAIKPMLPSWMVDIVIARKGLLPNDVANVLADRIDQWGTWVGENEVKLAKHVMEKCGDLTFTVAMDEGSRHGVHTRSSDDELVLVNVGNQHYMYARFPKTSTRRRKTLELL
jgi:hypothetical protein